MHFYWSCFYVYYFFPFPARELLKVFLDLITCLISLIVVLLQIINGSKKDIPLIGSIWLSSSLFWWYQVSTMLQCYYIRAYKVVWNRRIVTQNPYVIDNYFSIFFCTKKSRTKPTLVKSLEGKQKTKTTLHSHIFWRFQKNNDLWSVHSIYIYIPDYGLY